MLYKSKVWRGVMLKDVKACSAKCNYTVRALSDNCSSSLTVANAPRMWTSGWGRQEVETDSFKTK